MKTIQAKLSMVRQSKAITGIAKQNQAGVTHPRHPNTNRGFAAHRLSDCRHCIALLRLNFQNLPSPSNKPITHATPHPTQRQLTIPSHSPKPPCPLYALMLIDDTRGQPPPEWVPHAVAGVSTVPTIDDIHRHAWHRRSKTMAIYDDVDNRPLGGWIQRLVWCPTGDCRNGFRKRSTCDATELLFRSGTPGTF